MQKKSNIFYFNNAQELLDTVNSIVIETDVALDLGCGIVPSNYFRPKFHIMVEPWGEYVNILSDRHKGDKSVLIIKIGALEALHQFQDNSVDTIFLLDVIEHMEKEVGLQLLPEMERVARQQIILFTPLGFMPQDVDAGEKDAWGLSGAEMQKHKSGWMPADFSDEWKFYISENYHDKDFRGQLLKKPYGAFFAIRNFTKKEIVRPIQISDIRRPLPSEIELEKLNFRYLAMKQELEEVQPTLNALKSELLKIKSSRLYKCAVVIKRFTGIERV